MRTSAIGVNLFIFLHSLTHTYIHGALSSRRQMDHVTDVLCVLYTQYAPFFHNLTATVATLTHGNSHTHARTSVQNWFCGLCRYLRFIVAKCAQLSTAFYFVLHSVYRLRRQVQKNQLFIIFFVCVRQLSVALIREGCQKQKRKY